MKTRKFKILIQPVKKTLDDFEKTWKRVSKRRSGGTTEIILCFRDLSMVSKVLSPERLRLLQTVRERRPISVNQLSLFLGRTQANVHKDVHFLSKLGILELARHKKGRSKISLEPQFKWDGFDIAV